MHPLTVFLGFIMGSAVSITIGLAVTLFLMAVIDPDSATVRAEFRPLAETTLLFMALSAVAVTAFVAELRTRPWRFYIHALLAGMITLLVFHFLPD